MKRLKPLVILVIIFMIAQSNVVLAFDLDKKINKNVYVNNIELSGLTKEEAREKLLYNVKENRYFVLSYENKEILIDKNILDVEYEIDNLVKKAYEVGRDEDIISNIKTKVSLMRGNKVVIPLSYKYNMEMVDKLIEDCNKNIYLNPIDATAKVIDGQICVTKEMYGRKVDESKLKKDIIDNIKNLDSREIEICIKTLKPKYTYNQLKKIDTVLGSFETYFNISNENRTNNIEVAALATSNLIIGQNEKFSFNNTLKNKNARQNLKEAPIIKNGKSDRGLGGGICQVSTTIYNAALYSNMKIIEVNNHSMPSLYAIKGRDATVSEGYLDFVFQNKNKTPILIYNQVINNKIVSKIYGSKLDKKDIEIETQIVKILKNKQICKKDYNLKNGLNIVEQKGRLGYTVNTFRIYRENQKIIKKELINVSYYPPCDEIIIKGAKGSRY